jgi:hypothetical protein
MRRSLLIAVLLLSTTAYAGHDVLNGGDSMALDIGNLADQIAMAVSHLSPRCQVDKVDGFLFAQKEAPAIITTTPDVIHVDGDFKEADNNPKLVTIEFNRDAYRLSERHQQLIIHEVLGLMGVDDPHGQVSHALDLAIRDPSCLMQVPPVETRSSTAISVDGVPPRNLMPARVVADDAGILYLLDVIQSVVYRYDSRAQNYLPALKLKFEAKDIVYSRLLKRLYVANTKGRVTYIDLKDFQNEQEFAAAADEIESIQAIGRSVLVRPTSYEWTTDYLYGPDGQLQAQKDNQYPVQNMVYAEALKAIVYITDFSPRDLAIQKEDGVHLTSSFDLRTNMSMMDYALSAPIVIGPKAIVVGTGNVFRLTDTSFVARLPTELAAGVFVGDQLYTVSADGKGAHVLISWSDRYFEKTRLPLMGSFVALVANGRGATLITLTDDGLQYMNIGGKK